MPSTQTGTLSAAAKAVTARTIAEFSRLALMLVTKLRSILMISNGSDLRCDSDEKPVPKSSSASRTPWFFRLVTIVRARSRSANRELSVTSTTSRSAGKPVSASIRTIRWASQPSASCNGEMLTEILICGSQLTASRNASPITCSDRRPIRPISSATGIKTSGPISPESGWIQRASTSNPTMSPVARSTCGSK